MGNRTATLNGDDSSVELWLSPDFYHLTYPLTLDLLSRVFHLLLSTSNFFLTSPPHRIKLPLPPALHPLTLAPSFVGLSPTAVISLLLFGMKMDPLAWNKDTSRVDVNTWLSALADSTEDANVHPALICFSSPYSKTRFVQSFILLTLNTNDKLRYVNALDQTNPHFEMEKESYLAGATVSETYRSVKGIWIALVASNTNSVSSPANWHTAVLAHVERQWLVFSPGFTPPADPDAQARLRVAKGIANVHHIMQLMRNLGKGNRYLGMGDKGKTKGYSRRNCNTDNIFIAGMEDTEGSGLSLSATFVQQFLAGELGLQGKDLPPSGKQYEWHKASI